MPDSDSRKRLIRSLRSSVFLFLAITATLIYFFGFEWNGFEIKFLISIFTIMATAKAGFYFFRYLDARNISIFEYFDEILGVDRHKYIWYITGAIVLGLILSKVLIG